jgi:hypothetical protein
MRLKDFSRRLISNEKARMRLDRFRTYARGDRCHVQSCPLILQPQRGKRYHLGEFVILLQRDVPFRFEG